jgi:hypothetical protein
MFVKFHFAYSAFSVGTVPVSIKAGYRTGMLVQRAQTTGKLVASGAATGMGAYVTLD